MPSLKVLFASFDSLYRRRPNFPEVDPTLVPPAPPLKVFLGFLEIFALEGNSISPAFLMGQTELSLKGGRKGVG